MRLTKPITLIQKLKSLHFSIFFIVSMQVERYITSVYHVSNRATLIQLEFKSVDVNLFQVYKAESSDDEMEKFYIPKLLLTR